MSPWVKKKKGSRNFGIHIYAHKQKSPGYGLGPGPSRCGAPIVKLGRPGQGSKIRYPTLPYIHSIYVQTLRTLVILYKNFSLVCINHK